MATGTFNQPDFTSQGGTLYKTSIDNSVQAISRLATSYAAHEQTVPNMTVRVDAGFVWDGETLTNIAAQNTGTITAPVTHPRIDRVVVSNATGAVSVVTGAEAASPVEPVVGLGFAPVCKVLLATSTTAITNSMITDERTFDRGSGRSGKITNIASAATVDMGTVESHFANVTGTTGISSFGSSASTNDPLYIVRFDAALTLTHSGTFILPAAANITTAAGDYSLWQYLGFGVGWRLLNYTRTDFSVDNNDFGDMKVTARSAAPSRWLFARGQAISRTTYAGLFAAIGTTYGVGDGSTTFNIPDTQGRVVAGLEASATRLTSGVSGVDGATLGAAGGNQNMHQHTHTATVTDPGHTHTTIAGLTGFSAAGGGTQFVSGTTNSGSSTTGISVSNANAGTGSSQNVQPTIVLNWIIYAGV